MAASKPTDKQTDIHTHVQCSLLVCGSLMLASINYAAKKLVQMLIMVCVVTCVFGLNSMMCYSDNKKTFTHVYKLCNAF